MSIRKKHRVRLIGGMLLLSIIGLICSVSAQSDQGTVTLELMGIGLRHGTPDNLNLGTLYASSGEQIISGQFSDFFRVEDLEGYTTGHYITIQCDGAYGPYGNRLTGIYLKAGDDFPVLIQGTTGYNVLIATGLTDDYVSIMTPVTYIYKTTSPSNMGIINTYGDKPHLKIIIPGGTPPGIYSGTIVFSFYME